MLNQWIFLINIMINLKNKNIVITGASSGIGRQITLSAAELGANVIMVSRNIDKLKKIEDKLNSLYENQNFTSFKLDISNSKQVNNIFKDIIDKVKTIDVLINNAGITNDDLVMRMNDEKWHNVIETNLSGTFYCSRAISKQMIKQKNGKIINIGSIIGVMGNKGQANYAASKSGIIGLTKSLAKELSSRNITVNVINPGYISTDMTENLSNEQKDDFLKKIPLKRFGSTIEISELVCFLCSEKSNYITGQVLNIDGGITI